MAEEKKVKKEKKDKKDKKDRKQRKKKVNSKKISKTISKDKKHSKKKTDKKNSSSEKPKSKKEKSNDKDKNIGKKSAKANRYNRSSSAGIQDSDAPGAAQPQVLTRHRVSLEPSMLSYLEQLTVTIANLIENKNSKNVSENMDNQDQDQEEDDQTQPDLVPASELILLANNAIAELIPNFREISCHAIGSRVLEQLLDVTDDETYTDKLFPVLLSDDVILAAMTELAFNAFGSRVLEALLQRAFSDTGLLQNSQNTIQEQLIQRLKVFFSKMTPQLFIEWISDTRASHVMRSLMISLAGLNNVLSSNALSKLNESLIEQVQIRKSPHTINYLVSNVIKKTIYSIDSSDLENMIYYTHPSAFLQTLLVCIQEEKFSSVYVDLAYKIFGGEDLKYFKDALYDTSASRLVETLISFCRDDDFIHRVYQQHFKGHLVEMSKDFKANYIVRALVRRIHTIPMLKMALQELETQASWLISNLRSGIILELARKCNSLGDIESQTTFIENLASAFGAVGNDSNKFLLSMLHMDVHKISRWQKSIISFWNQANPEDPESIAAKFVTPIDRVGSFLVQSLLQYRSSNVSLLRDCFSCLTEMEAFAIALDGAGSRVLECFLEWTRDPDQNQRKVIDLLCPKVSCLALSPCASRVVEKAYALANVEQRKLISGGLAAHMQLLRDNPYSRYALKICRVQEFLHRRDTWIDQESQRDRKIRMFDEIIDDHGKSTEKNQSKVKDKHSTKKKREKSVQLDNAMSILGFGHNDRSKRYSDDTQEPITSKALRNKSKENQAAEGDGNEIVQSVLEAIANIYDEPSTKKKKR